MKFDIQDVLNLFNAQSITAIIIMLFIIIPVFKMLLKERDNKNRIIETLKRIESKVDKHSKENILLNIKNQAMFIALGKSKIGNGFENYYNNECEKLIEEAKFIKDS